MFDDEYEMECEDDFGDGDFDFDGSDLDDLDLDTDDMFEDPGGESALRRATADNPRIHPCPTCGEPDCLTAKDVALRYQCDRCADRAEGKCGY